MNVDADVRPGSRAGEVILDERLQRAKHALARAEMATGIRTSLSSLASREQPASGAASVAAVSSAVSRFGPGAGDDRFLRVPDALAPLVPSGGLRRGSVVQVGGSASLLLSLTAEACRDGAWCAVVGMPDLGLAAAAEIGLPLDRTALVPRPGAAAAAVLGAALDGFDIVVAGPVPQLTDRDRRQLSSRLRHRSAVLLSTHPWPGAELVLSVTRTRWGGIGQGSGSLRERELVVEVDGRGAAAGVGVYGRLRSPDGFRLVQVPDAVEPVSGRGPSSGSPDRVRRAG